MSVVNHVHMEIMYIYSMHLVRGTTSPLGAIKYVLSYQRYSAGWFLDA